MLFDKGFLAMGNVSIILMVLLTLHCSLLLSNITMSLSDSLRVWCYTNHWAELNRTVLHEA
jgi:hypothetical protein